MLGCDTRWLRTEADASFLLRPINGISVFFFGTNMITNEKRLNIKGPSKEKRVRN